MYLQAELARNEGNMQEQDSLVQQMMTRYPQSRWLEEALNSGGNMYLLKHATMHTRLRTTLPWHSTFRTASMPPRRTGMPRGSVIACGATPMRLG